MKPKELSFQQNSILWLILILGILARFNIFYDNPSLWLDEATLAINLISKNYWGLTSDLDYQLIIPTGYLWVQKLCFQLTNYSEWGLRIPSFLASIGVLTLTLRLLKKRYEFWLILVGLMIASFSYLLIEFAGEGRRYEVEIFISLILFSLWFDNKSKWFFIVSFVSVFFSYSSFFVLGGVLIFELINRYPFQKLIKHLSWLIPACFIYLFQLYNHPYSELMVDYHTGEGSLFGGSLYWLINVAVKWISEPLGITMHLLGLGLCSLGLVQIYFRKSKLEIGILIIALAIVFGVFDLYPVGHRFTLYLFPFLLLILLDGLTFVYQRSWLAFGVAVLVLLVHPSSRFIDGFFKSSIKEDWRGAVKELALKQNPKEEVYCSHNSMAPLKYYEYRNFLSTNIWDKRRGNFLNDKATFIQDIKSIETKEFWVLIGHDYPIEDDVTTAMKLDWLKKQYQLVRHKKYTGNIHLLYLKQFD